MGTFRIRIEQDYLKFSAAHFLLFANGTCERVHGHNYRVRVELQGGLSAEGFVFDFLQIKPLVKTICDRWDHRVLLPQLHEELKLRQDARVVEATYHDRRYCFPAEDVVLLPVRNTTVELLARHLAGEIGDTLKKEHPVAHLTAIRVAVEESFGQEAFYEEVFSA